MKSKAIAPDKTEWEKSKEIERQEVTKEATKVRDRLNNYFKCTGWYFEVWYSNLRWHYDVNIGSISVHPSPYHGGWFSLVGAEIDKPHGGLSNWTIHKTFDTPEMAALYAINAAAALTKQLSETVENNLELLRIRDFEPFNFEGQVCKRCKGELKVGAWNNVVTVGCETCGQTHTQEGELI